MSLKRLENKVRSRTWYRTATAVAFAREGATIVGIDIAGPVSATLEVEPATRDELDETGQLVEAAGGRWGSRQLD
ncbi:hypothetical protein [Nitrobacter hamburgensis]|uniref:hypothetical protein n=1 Tax=Nitrobacter hamburgensis TaxID=912 RepID=UPI000055721E